MKIIQMCVLLVIHQRIGYSCNIIKLEIETYLLNHGINQCSHNFRFLSAEMLKGFVNHLLLIRDAKSQSQGRAEFIFLSFSFQ